METTSSRNRILGLAIYSLTNALELYQTSDESHRFGAIILMDLSVEYLLKAQLYELNPSEFMESEEKLGFSNVIEDKRITFVGNEKIQLKRVHTIRNFAQHRSSIPDSLSTAQYMEWLCKFVRRFSLDNFKVNIRLPSNLIGTWTRLTNEIDKTDLIKPFNPLKPLDENYNSVKNWLRQREEATHRPIGFIEIRKNLMISLAKYCEFEQLDPDSLIRNAKNGIFSPDEHLNDFLKTDIGTPRNYWSIIKGFYLANNVPIRIPSPPYHPRFKTLRITTEQLRKMLDVADNETRSWILVCSYTGLSIGKIPLLTVEDFYIENWAVPKPFYPVKIREEVSGSFGYTTFIGVDAKDELEKYFSKRNFNSLSHPWADHYKDLMYDFNKYVSNSNINPKEGVYRITSSSLIKRLREILLKSGMRSEWIYYILGQNKAKNIDRPMDAELIKDYEKAIDKLRVY